MSVRSAQLTNLGDCLRLPARGHDVAFVDLLNPGSPVEVTALELDALICSIARGLVSCGYRRDDRIAILSANRLEFVASYCAIMRMGAQAVPINYKLTKDAIEHILLDSGCCLAIVDRERRALLPPHVDLIDFDSRGADGLQAILNPGSFTAVTPGEVDLAEILYTSGSTGRPKGVPLTHGGQCWAIEKYLSPLDHDAHKQTVTPIVAPLYHMNGLFFTCIALANRMRIISLPRFDADEYLTAVVEHRCTYLTGVPSMMALAMRAKRKPQPQDLAHVERVHIGSAPLTQGAIDEIRALFPSARITNGYGTTEAGPAVFGPHPAALDQPPSSIGYPYPDVAWRFSNDSSIAGPLELRTPALTAGYLNRSDLTAKQLDGGWYHTGDVMRRDDNGFFYFVARVDDMFVCGGENLYPGQIEELIESHPDVAQCAVVALADPIKGAVPVAFVVLHEGRQADATALKDFALRNGPAYAHPRHFFFEKELPLGGTNKIDKRALLKKASDLAHRSTAVVNAPSAG